MSTGSNNTDGERIASVFNRAGYLARSAFTEGQVAVAYAGSGADNMDACLPSHADARDGGRDFYGIWMNSGTATISTDRGPIQKLGVAKCVLKANTACYAGTIAAFDPADGGSVVPWTNGKQVPIGRFAQNKSSSSAVQFVGVELAGAGSIGLYSDTLLGAITSNSSAVTNTTTETAFDQKVTIPANLLTAGSVIRIKAKVAATATNSTDTLQILCHLNTTAGVTLATSSAVDVADNDLLVLDIAATIRVAGASGTMTVGGMSVVKTTAKAVGTVSTIAIDTTTSNDIVISGVWSVANAGNSCRLEDLSVSLLRVAA